MIRRTSLAFVIGLFPGLSAIADVAPKDPSAVTVAAQAKVLQSLPFSDRSDFERVEKGLIKRPENLVIKNEDGSVAWQLANYDFLKSDQQSDSINPSLLRQARLNMSYGLFKVVDGVYQVRGYPAAPRAVSTQAPVGTERGCQIEHQVDRDQVVDDQVLLTQGDDYTDDPDDRQTDADHGGRDGEDVDTDVIVQRGCFRVDHGRVPLDARQAGVTLAISC